jgi:molybdopterin-synthase adenylyltransferase
MPREWSIALSSMLDAEIAQYLIREDGQEDLLFALWTPSKGNRRLTGLMHTLVYPVEGDRQRHGNASFNPQYFERVCSTALAEGCGIAFLHSHPVTGWQGMSHDDVIAEQKMAGAVSALTDLPLIGMTVGSDGTWSARMWEHLEGKKYGRRWCTSVRKVGEQLRSDFNNKLVPMPVFREHLRRTITVWGEENHAHLARLRIGIVGLGSVGSMVADALAHIGVERFVLIDFDEIQTHNRDRLIIATDEDIGKLKILVAEQHIRKVATAEWVEVTKVPYSIAEEQGYRAVLDCDVLFSCVDRPRPRQILNHLAYAHLIPVIDGGIAVRFKQDKFFGVDWQLQTVTPERPCLECLGAFDSADVETEKAGKLDDPSYLKGLPPEHRFKRNENVYPFSANLASLEVLQFIALTTGIAGIANFGVQRYRYSPGILESDVQVACRPNCSMSSLVAQGDRHFHLYGRDIGAEMARKRHST